MIREAVAEEQTVDLNPPKQPASPAPSNKASEQQVQAYLEKETERYLEFYAHMTRRGTEYDLPAVLKGVLRYHKTDMKRDKKVKDLLGALSDAELKQLSDQAVMSYLKRTGLLKNLQGRA